MMLDTMPLGPNLVVGEAAMIRALLAAVVVVSTGGGAMAAPPILARIAGAAETHEVERVANARVRGHTTRSGRYVAPHTRTTPDRSRTNNYSTRGNTNPYTGRAGTQAPYRR